MVILFSIAMAEEDEEKAQERRGVRAKLHVDRRHLEYVLTCVFVYTRM